MVSGGTDLDDASEALIHLSPHYCSSRKGLVGASSGEHLLSHLWESVVPGQSEHSLATRTTLVCPCRHNSLPNSAMGQGPLLATVR